MKIPRLLPAVHAHDRNSVLGDDVVGGVTKDDPLLEIDLVHVKLVVEEPDVCLSRREHRLEVGPAALFSTLGRTGARAAMRLDAPDAARSVFPADARLPDGAAHYLLDLLARSGRPASAVDAAGLTRQLN